MVSPSHDDRISAFAVRLGSVETLDELADALHVEVSESVGFTSVWIGVFEPSLKMLRHVAVRGTVEDDLWRVSSLFPITADGLLTDLLETREAQVIEDAQIDDRVNHEIAQLLKTRTIVLAPLQLTDERRGLLGATTHGAEGVRLPTSDDVSYLEDLAGLTTKALSRVPGA